MVAFNAYNRSLSARTSLRPPGSRLAERVRHYFDRHPEVSREEFLREAVQREIYLREQTDTEAGTGPRGRTDGEAAHRFRARPALTAEDIRIHAWLTERLAMLHYERHGLWPRFKRFFFGNRPGRRR
jgi:hypothetical protein